MQEDASLCGELTAYYKFIIKDYKYLLQLNLREFWMQILFDKTILASIDSYLKTVSRDYISSVKHFPAPLRALHDEIHRCVFFILLRCALHKDPKSGASLERSLHARLLYDYFVFDVPRIIDFVQLYAPNNAKLVQKMIKSILNDQPHFHADFINAFDDTEQVLNRLCDSGVGVQPNLTQFIAHQSPYKSESSDANVSRKEMCAILDAMRFVQDMMECFHSLLCLGSRKTDSTEEKWVSPFLPLLLSSNVAIKLAQFYDLFVPFLHSKYDEFFCAEEDSGDSFDADFRCEFEEVSANMSFSLVQCCSQLLLAMTDTMGGSRQVDLESVLLKWQTLLNAPLFLCACEAIGPLRPKLAKNLRYLTATNAGSHTSAEYILSSISVILTDLEQRKPLGYFAFSCLPFEEQFSQQLTVNPPVAEKDNATATPSSSAPVAPTAGPVTDLEEICSIFPHIPQQTVEAYLHACSQNVDRAIAMLCEYQQPDTGGSSSSQYSPHYNEEVAPVAQNSSALDEQLKLSKKEKEAILKYEMISDEDEEDDEMNGNSTRAAELNWERALRRDARHAGVVRQFSDLNPLEFEDEYDDTYDSHLAACEHETTQENFTADIINPNRLQTGNQLDTEELNPNARNSFVPVHRDVRGRGRGRGQTTEVLRNREWKEKNKSKSANHNRRFLADKKRRGAF